MEFYLIQDTTILGHGGGLRKCWEGYKIAKSEGDGEYGILCKRYKEIPTGTENICIKIPTIWSVRSKLLQLQTRILITLINQSRRDTF
ncbi:MAG: hypothetical protein DLM72_18560 [Candidatus Nitrosopolaris wilkensis]|nr:MAG: hypothetical protein DLM72_18560 [Candidatus Nitrosopolaris wilkensis]